MVEPLPHVSVVAMEPHFYPVPLPPVSASKLEAIGHTVEEAHGLLMMAQEARREAAGDRQQAIRVLQSYIDGRPGRVTPFDVMTDLDRVARIAEGDIEVHRAKAVLDRHTAEVQKRRAVEAQRQERWSALAGLREDLDAYLRRLPTGTQAVPAPSPKPKIAGSVSAAVEKVRQHIATLKADQGAVEAAPIPSRVAKEKARAAVRDLVDQGRPTVASLIEHGGAITWPRQMSAPPAGMDPSKYTPVFSVDPVATFAWLFADKMVERLADEIDAVSDDERALTDEQRASRTQDIQRQLLALEHEEEALIVLAKEQGTEILRRRDADPRAVLGFQLVNVPMRGAA